jgi:DNA adenine methylase
MSFGGKWFGGYRRDHAGDAGNIENMKNQSRRSKESLLKQIENLKDVEFYNVNYWELNIPEGSIIYLDPPYQGVTNYRDEFNHDKFWNWTRKISVKNEVFISEYNAPDDFEIVFEKKLINTLDKDATGNKKGIERLFKLKSSCSRYVNK